MNKIIYLLVIIALSIAYISIGYTEIAYKGFIQLFIILGIALSLGKLIKKRK